MGLLQHHPEKLAFALVVALCIGFALQQRGTSDSSWEEELQRNQALIHKALANPKNPSPAYQYSPQALAEMLRSTGPSRGRFSGGDALLPAVPEFVAYPRLPRPLVEPPPLPPGVKVDFAVLKPPADLKARAEPGRVCIEFARPRSLKYMELVRVEIFRGTTEDQLEGTPYAVVQCEPATASATHEPGAAESPAAERPRRSRHEPAPAATPADAAGAAGAERFADTHVEAHKTYYYRLRAVGRMTLPPNASVTDRSALGGTETTVIRPPQEALLIQSGPPGAVALYATPLSAPKAVTAESNFRIRLAGTIGTIPRQGSPTHPSEAGYKGNFCVRVWIPEAQMWGEATVRAGVSERIKGKVLYKNPETRQPDAYAFDTGYELIEIKWGEITTAARQTVPLIGPGGVPLLNPAGKLITKEITVQSTPIHNEVAILKNTLTATIEEFPKRSAQKN